MSIPILSEEQQDQHDKAIGLIKGEVKGNVIFIARRDSLNRVIKALLTLIVESNYPRTMVVVEDHPIKRREAPKRLRSFTKKLKKTPKPEGLKEKHHFHGLVLPTKDFYKFKNEHFANAKEDTDETTDPANPAQ